MRHCFCATSLHLPSAESLPFRLFGQLANFFNNVNEWKKDGFQKESRKRIILKILKPIYIILGSISLALGTLGIFLPLLPTTPFYLLTAWLYMRGSKKMYDKVMSNKYFGTIVRDFQEDKSISLRTKIIVVSMIWGSILFSAFWVVSVWWLRILLLAIATGTTIHILSFRTKRK